MRARLLVMACLIVPSLALAADSDTPVDTDVGVDTDASDTDASDTDASDTDASDTDTTSDTDYPTDGNGVVALTDEPGGCACNANAVGIGAPMAGMLLGMGLLLGRRRT